MIRILTLLVSLFTFGLVDLAEITYEIPVQDMLYFRDTPIAELNDLTLNELFIDSYEFNYEYTSVNDRLVFSSDSTRTFDYQYNNSLLSTTSLLNNFSYGYTGTFLVNSDKYYILSSIKPLNNLNSIYIGFSNTSNRTTINNPILNEYTTYSLYGFPNNSRIDFGVNGPINNVINIDYFKILNLTSLGLTSLTKAQLDRYYELWQNPELNITYTINQLDTQDLIILLASQSVWTISIYVLQKYAYRSYKKSKRMGM